MGTLANRLPDDIERGAEGGHGYWKATIVAHEGGYETPNLDWQDARGEWNIGRALELTGKHEIARSHFYKARGMFHHWRFKDWHDFRCARTGADLGRLIGSTTAWQINKVYGADEPTFEYVRPLKRIVSGTEQIWRNNVLQVATTDYTLDIDTGIVTSVSSWAGATLEVACEFDVLCRYDTPRFAPRLEYRYSASKMLFKWDDINIVEVRE
ncbi:MAG: DUF2460 domain-containing protein [Burkholderiaceae bacterium]